jgi:hypothetical protein
MDFQRNLNYHTLIDDNQRKQIADEAERLANQLPAVTIKKMSGRNPLAKDLLVHENAIELSSIVVDIVFVGNDQFTTRFRRSLATYTKVLSYL